MLLLLLLLLEGIFFYACIWLKLKVFAADNNSQVDGWLVQREAGGEVQRGLLRADGRRSLTGVQVFRIELLCCLLSDRSQTSTPIHLKHCIAPIHPKGRLMGSPSRFQACEPHMPFQCQSNAASSLINWLDFFTMTLKTATTLMVVSGDPQQGRVDEVGGHPQHQRLPSQRRLRRQHDHTHP